MSAHKLKRTVFRKANRSGFHHLVCPVRHAHHMPEAKFDALGGGIIVSLSVGTVLLVRLILTK